MLDKSTKLLKSKKLEYEKVVHENQITPTTTTTTTTTTMLSTDVIYHKKNKKSTYNKDLDEISNDADVDDDEDDLT